MSNYTFIKLESENIKHLYTLFTAVYNKSCPKQYFDLKYATQYTGAEYIGFFAFENNIPVAYYGVVPTIISISRQRVLAAQSCDTMTHPAHTKKGLFTELAKRTFELAKQKGIHFVFGFPNQNSYPGFIKHLGFTHTETMNRYTISLSNTPFKLLYRK
ncbi:MAG: GNAT family N-acetyltransferase, partial [Bacteroidota bacterium]